MYVSGFTVNLEIFLTKLGGISSCPQDLFPFRLLISFSTSFSVTASKKIEFTDLFPKNVVKLTLLPWILSANFGPMLMKYSLNLLLISLRSVINLCSGHYIP